MKREISRVLRREVHDPRVGLVLVTGVEASADLSVASVFVRPSGAEKDWGAMMEGLEAAAPFVRRELAKDLKMRKVPELHFREDRTLESAMRIEKILDEVLPETPEEGAEGDSGSGAGEDPDGSAGKDSGGDADGGVDGGADGGADGGTGDRHSAQG